MAEFSVEFRIVAANANWNIEALCGFFVIGLSER